MEVNRATTEAREAMNKYTAAVAKFAKAYPREMTYSYFRQIAPPPIEPEADDGE